MKFYRGILLGLVLISISACADTIRNNLNTSVSFGPNQGVGDNVGVFLSGQGVSIFAIGGTPTFWFDGYPPEYFPGDLGLGPTTIFWDTGLLVIGSHFYGTDEFHVDPTELEVPFITFPLHGRDFTVTVPMVWDLDGTIFTDCPSDGCGFAFGSKPGMLHLSFVYDPQFQAYYGSSGSFTVSPEPSTVGLMVIGIMAVYWQLIRRTGCHRQARPT